MLPGVLQQLGADSLTGLRRMAEALPKQLRNGKVSVALGEEEEEVAGHVENLDEASMNGTN